MPCVIRKFFCWLNCKLKVKDKHGDRNETSCNECTPCMSESGPDAEETIYKRPLPEICIGYSTKRGKEIFKEAMEAGHMECYFNLAAQFVTQEDNFCGLTTLLMVLNTLEVDPGKTFFPEYRWYRESMLNCCSVTVKVVEIEGTTLDQFVCLATCHGLTARMVRVDDNASEEDFRQAVLEYTKEENKVLVTSYGRALLNQHGIGHFSPICGYHPEQDLVLILDVARFKYPPYWVSLHLLFEAMKELDPDIGLPRGYVMMKKNEKDPKYTSS